MSKENQQVNPYPIRLTKELRDKLEMAAKVGGRSLNAEMLIRLESSFENNLDEMLTPDDVKKIALEVFREEFSRVNNP